MSFRLSACRGILTPRLQLSRGSPHVTSIQAFNRSSSRLLATTSNVLAETHDREQKSQLTQEDSADAVREQELTGSAKLLAEALVEEETVKAKEHWRERSEKEAADAP